MARVRRGPERQFRLTDVRCRRATARAGSSSGTVPSVFRVQHGRDREDDGDKAVRIASERTKQAFFDSIDPKRTCGVVPGLRSVGLGILAMNLWSIERSIARHLASLPVCKPSGALVAVSRRAPDVTQYPVPESLP